MLKKICDPEDWHLTPNADEPLQPTTAALHHDGRRQNNGAAYAEQKRSPPKRTRPEGARALAFGMKE
jgi:hypothetical protein